MVGARAIALFADDEQQAEIANAAGPARPPTAKIMEAMMPLVSQAARPQMNSLSSREGKNGGTVSMWVESVTVGSPKRSEHVEAAGFHVHALHFAVVCAANRER